MATAYYNNSLYWKHESVYHSAPILWWANHIIQRFGREGAEKFIYGCNSCPCIELERDCKTCKYNIGRDLCSYAKKWMSLECKDKCLIKDCIMDKLT